MFAKKVLGKEPRIGKDCFIAHNATLVGNIEIGNNCSIWFGAVLRADVDYIKIGDNVNVQDLACVHQSHGTPVIIEDNVSIGHNAVVHGCTLKNGCLIGMSATVLDGAVVGNGAVIAAGAVVLQGTIIGDGEIWAGVPAKFVKKAEERQALEYSKHYLEAKEWYVE